MMTRLDRLLSLGAALVGSALLLVAYPADQTPAPAAPVPAATAWPRAQNATVSARLPDGMAYQPAIFLDARTSVGTAPDPDQRSQRLVLRGEEPSVRQLRSRPLDERPWFGGFTVAGNVLAWAEEAAGGHLELWTIDLRDGRPARQLTADTGEAVLHGSPYDLLIAGGRLYWAASNPDHRDVTEIRSVALTGGPVDVRAEPGAWQLSAWPWLVNGLGDPGGTTALKNVLTNEVLAVPSASRESTHCGPIWCEEVSFSSDGYRTELMHPDGTARQPVPSATTQPAIAEVAPLDRFEVLSQTDPYSDLTGTTKLLVYDMATRRTVEISGGTRTVSYNAGVLWWSTGTLEAPVWHALDLRTV
jgi:hypothetical protein